MKSFDDFSIDEAMKTRDVKRVANTIAGKTDMNDHTGALLFLAMNMKANKFVNILKGIEQIAKAEGSIPEHVYQYRQQVYKELHKLAKKFYKDDYALIHGAF